MEAPNDHGILAEEVNRRRGSQRDARRNAELADELEVAREAAAREPGLLDTFQALAGDSGIGVGWAAVYFKVFKTLWRGQRRGKRLMGTRVLRRDGGPITWWAAFERFGGYATGLATGLLGFAQILWDANRQAVHDKIAGTVVVRSRSGYPAPGSREAKAS